MVPVFGLMIDQAVLCFLNDLVICHVLSFIIHHHHIYLDYIVNVPLLRLLLLNISADNFYFFLFHVEQIIRTFSNAI